MLSRSSTWGLALFAVGLLTLTAAAQQVDNPEYLAWAACKTGTTVTMLMKNPSNQADGSAVKQRVEVTDVEKLVEVMPDMAVVSVERSINFINAKTSLAEGFMGAASIYVVPARIEKDAVGAPSALSLAEKDVAGDPWALSFVDSAKFSGRKEGKETLEINGKSVEATSCAFRREVNNDEGKPRISQVKYWFAPEVPGGFVKVEDATEGKGAITVVMTGYAKSAIAVPRPPEDLDDRTPKGLLRSVDRAPLESVLAVAKASYSANTANGKTFAEACAAENYAEAKMEKAVRDHFGAATSAVDDVDHVLGYLSRRDIESSNAEVGEQGYVISTRSGSLPMTRVSGHWRVDVDAMVHDFDAAEFKLNLQQVRDTAALSERLAGEVAAGKYKTEDDLKKAAQAAMDKITPPATKP